VAFSLNNWIYNNRYLYSWLYNTEL